METAMPITERLLKIKIGMGAEREATLLGKVERQSAALKLAKERGFCE